MDRRDDTIRRMWEHVQSLHRLNGWSKSKGWWCSCGARHHHDPPVPVHPWTPEGREIALLVHTAHLIIVRRHLLTGEPLPPNHQGHPPR